MMKGFFILEFDLKLLPRGTSSLQHMAKKIVEMKGNYNDCFTT